MRTNNRHKLKFLRRDLRTFGTQHEATLWLILKNRQVGGARFRRQFSVGPYVLDFYCPELKLCIELDGADHFTAEGAAHDEVRTAYLAGEGIEVLRFENRDLFEKQTFVLNAITKMVEERKEMLKAK